MERRTDRTSRRACCVLACVVCFAAPAPGRAAPRAGDAEALSMDTLLDPSLEVASLHEESVSESASAGFVITREDIRLHGFRTLFDALRTVPGLFGYHDDIFPMIGVRGLGLLTDYGTRLLVLVNGHAMNDSVGLGGTIVGRDLPLPIDAVKRIEVVKGPVGSIYGPTAFLGVVNVVTVEGDDRASQVYVAGDASQSRILGGEGAAVLATSGSAWSLTAAASGFGARGQEYFLPELLIPQPGRPTPAGSVGAANGMDAQNVFARLDVHGVALMAACGRSSTGPITGGYGSNVADDRTRVTVSRCLFDVGYDWKLAPRFTLALKAGWDALEYTDSWAYAPPPDGIGIARDLGRDRWGWGEVRGTWLPSSDTLLIAGLKSELHETLQRVYADGLPTLGQDPVNGYGPGDIARDFATLNGYLLLERRVAPAVNVTFGVTWYWHQLFGQRLTPKAAAVWTVSPRDVLKLVYSQGFRTPKVSEALYEDGTDYLANPALRPEVVNAGELVYERRLGSSLTVTASAFVHEYTDLIRYHVVPAPGSTDPGDVRQQPINSGSIWLYGGELSGTVHLGRWIRGYGGVSWQRTDLGDLPNSPALTANVAMATRALWEPLSLAANVAIIGRRAKDPGNPAADGSTSVAPSAIVNASAVLDVPGTRSLSVEARVTNLFGAGAPDPAPVDFQPVTELPQAPRTFRVGLRYRFD